MPNFSVGVRLGLGNDELVFYEEEGASLLIFSDVEFVLLLEILGDVDWFLWELEFATGIWNDKPILLFFELIRV